MKFSLSFEAFNKYSINGEDLVMSERMSVPLLFFEIQ